MLEKLKEKKAMLESTKAGLVAEIEKLDNKIAIVDEMIAEESLNSVEEAEATPIVSIRI